MAKLYALDYIQYGMDRYKPGDLLPADAAAAERWVEAGAARWVEDDFARTKGVTAERAAAEPGLFGKAEGGELTGNDLVGRVPQTALRERGRWIWKP